ncbi:M48 family metallopeptidase [Microbispora sp. H10949]|uniref:M48 family metallopeptidase n=1 Tax=Microbispora sp. H10949 TaxID=2729111 RepID=UPI0016032514|nr:M48 family metalloprotease [Microbispora sp. H10949]
MRPAAESAAATEDARPSPFAVPSATTSRFALLVVAISLITLTYGPSTVPGMGERPTGDYAGVTCFRNLVNEATRRAGTPVNLFDADTYRLHGSCPEGAAANPAPGLRVLAVYWLVVLAMWWATPLWRLRRRRLRPLPVAEMPELPGYLAELRRVAGVGTRVTFVVDYLDPRISGLAFGRPGRRHILLSGGLLATFVSDRPVFRAVVLHELAHLRNRDVDLGFITIAAWRVFLVLILAPDLFSFLRLPAEARLRPSYGFAATLAGQLVVLAVYLLLAGNAVLRSRELHADARAAQWSGGPDDLARLFAPHAGVRIGRLRHSLGSHPATRDRLLALADTSALLRMGFGESLTMGLAISLVQDIGETVFEGKTAFWVFAVLLATGVGLGIWRMEIAAYVLGDPTRVNRVGLGLGLGLAVGGTVSPTWPASEDLLGRSSIGAILPWCVLLFLGGWLFVRWMAVVARAWMPVAAAARRPALVVVTTLAVAAVLLGIGFVYALPLALIAGQAQALLFPGLPQTSVFFIEAVVVLITAPEALRILTLLTIAVYPLVGTVLARRLPSRPAPSWLTLDPLPPGWRSASQLPGEGGTAIRSGLVVACFALLLAFTGYFVSFLTARDLAVSFIRFYGMETFDMATMALTSVIATARARDSSVLWGIVGASVAGLVVVIGERVLFHTAAGIATVAFGRSAMPVLSSAVRDSPMYLSWMLSVFAEGIELASLVALVTAAVDPRRLRRTPAP